MTRILAHLLVVLPTLAAADSQVSTGNSNADALIATALGEQRVFITCSLSTQSDHDLIAQGWQRDAAKAAFLLLENKVPPDAITAFVAAAKVEALLPAEGTAQAEVIAFCDANPNWEQAYYTLNFTLLEFALPGAFAK